MTKYRKGYLLVVALHDNKSNTQPRSGYMTSLSLYICKVHKREKEKIIIGNTP